MQLISLCMYVVATDLAQYKEAVKRAKIVRVKWIYKTKLNEKGEVDKFKARVVVKGYAQQYKIDYVENFALVACMETVHLLIVLGAQRGWPIHQLDVMFAFLHGELIEDVFVDQPHGYIQKGNDQKVCKLKNTLYGLKQDSHCHIEAYFIKKGLQKCDYEHALFIEANKKGDLLIVSLYVDNFLSTRNDELMFTKFKNSMNLEFNMIDINQMKYFLGLEVKLKLAKRSTTNRCYNVLEWIKTIMSKLQLFLDERRTNVNKTHFKQMMFAISLLSRYMENLIDPHLQLAKRVLRCLKGTFEYGIYYKKGESDGLIAYIDNDYVGCLDNEKTLRMCLSSRITSCIMVIKETTNGKVLRILDQMQDETITIRYNNNFTIKLSKN
ncbi:Copia protein, partial [Mucuna pruriens]